MAPLGRLGSPARLPGVPGPPQGRELPFPFLGLFSAPSRGMWRACFPQLRFTMKTGASWGGGRQTLGPGTGRVKAAPALEPARRGTSSGVLASPRVAKVQACKVGIGPARRGKKAWFPLPLPGVAPIGSAAGPAPPSPGAPRPHPRRSATPPSGQERGPELNERNSATLIGLGLDAAPRGRRGAENGARTCDAPHFL